MKRYDIIIIGGGVAGLVAASGAAQLGAKVALIEKQSLGGDCLRSGCVPTKRLLYSAKIASNIKRSSEFGIKVKGFEVDFPSLMQSMRRVQAIIGEHDSPERFVKMGVDVIIGSGRFVDAQTFEISGEKFKGRSFIIATGSRPLVVPVPGLRELNPLTNETALKLERLPESVLILGGGPIGVEFAQIFARLGSSVTIIERAESILPREDKELSGLLMKALAEEGIKIVCGAEVKEALMEDGRKAFVCRDFEGEKVYRADEVMAAIGRLPNVDGLELEKAGVEYDRKKGIRIDRRLQTTNKRIYACGDCAGPYAFTHFAEYQAGIALGNALFPLIKRKADYRVVPWTTFTDPELARVGLTEDEARAMYGSDEISVYRVKFESVDRAVIEGEAKGLVKLVCKERRILGAHILGKGAGELIHEYVLAMKENLPVTSVSASIHVYPTLSMADKRAADEYYRRKLFSGWFPKLAKFLIRFGI